MTKSFALREKINAQFDQARALADAVLFEFGRSRRINLELRRYIRQWQPQLRTLFVLRIASWKYRAQLPGFEVPYAVRLRQKAYDDVSARMLEQMADRIEKPVSSIPTGAEELHELLSRRLHDTEAEAFRELPVAQAESFVTFFHRIDELTDSLAKEMAADGVCWS